MGKFESMAVETFDSSEGLRDRLYLNVGEDSGLTTIDVSGAVERPVRSSFVVCMMLLTQLLKP